MSPVSDNEIHAIVTRVVRQTLGAEIAPATAAEFQAAKPPEVKPAGSSVDPAATSRKVVAIGTDHGGVDLKNLLIKELNNLGYAVQDCGTHTTDPVDYPDVALAVATLVAEGKAWRGVVIDGAGIGSCMAANKVPGVRAAMCYDYATAVNSREHNDANVLTLGAGLIGNNLARQILTTWLATDFSGGRHAKRVDKIMAIEKKYGRDGKAA